MRLNLVIGLTGKPGSGKGTFSHLLYLTCLKDSYSPAIGGPRFSDALRDTLELFDIPFNRSNPQALAQFLKTLKADAITCAMRKKLEMARSSYDIVIADGLRWPHDETMIRGFEKNLIVRVHARPELRYERMKVRKEKVGEIAKSWEEFLREDGAETEQYIDDIGSRADAVIDNNETVEDYQHQVDAFYYRFVKPLRTW